MLNLLTLSIGVGLLVCLIFVGYLGLMTGGMVVPGYIALVMHDPGSVILTLVDALIIFFIARILSHFLIIYGRRRIALIMLISFLLGVLMREIFSSYYIARLLWPCMTFIFFVVKSFF